MVITINGPAKLVNMVDPGSPCGTLPVTFTNFSARLNNNTVDLQWKINNEINLRSFDVEYSTDGVSFSELGSLNYHKGIANYTFTHLTPIQSNFYRLRMVDTDGKYFYSKILSVQKNTGGNKVILMYPNPAFSDLTIQLNAASLKEKVVVNIIDNSGRIVINKIFVLPSGLNYLSIDGIEKLPPSIYMVRVKSQSVSAVEKLVVGKK